MGSAATMRTFSRVGWVTRVGRLARRGGVHARRAGAALRRIGPGRHPGGIDEIVAFSDGLTIRGHVLTRTEAPLPAILVNINGEVATLATVSTSIARSAGDGSKRIGWEVLVPSGRLPDGDLRVDVSSIDSSGLVESLEHVVWPAGSRDRPRPLDGVLDHPVDGSLAEGGVCSITGWVVGARHVDRVDITVDGAPVDRARLFCIERPDVVERTAESTDRLCGFSYQFDLEGLEVGSTHEVAVEAVGMAGRRDLGRRTIVVGAAARTLTSGDRQWLPALMGRAELAASASVPAEGLNLLVVTHDLNLGGAQLWLHQILMRLLEEWDVACTVISRRDGVLRVPLEQAGARVQMCGPFPGTYSHYESVIKEIIGRLVSEGTNIVLANTSDAFIGVDAAVRCGLPSVYAIHEHFPVHVRYQNVFGPGGVDEHVMARGQFSLERATAVGFVADATRKLYLPDEDTGRAVTVPYGIRTDLVDAARQRSDRDQLRLEHGYLTSDQVLVCIADIDARKGQSGLVMAFSRIAEERPHAQLVMVGASGTPYHAAVAALVESLGLSRRVRIVATVDDVSPWWVMADGFVLASDSESLPRSIIEAMAFGVPVLATDVGGVSELIVDGHTGFLVAPSEVGELTRALLRLLDADRRLLADMTGRSARLVRETRDGAQYVEAYLGLLRALAKDPGLVPATVLTGG